jgi:drug/metabolite transporter (DMT)-like permease
LPALTADKKSGTTTAMQKQNTLALAALAFTTLVWGVTPVFVRSVSLFLGPNQALIIRLVLTGLVFTLILSLTTGFAIERRDLWKLILLSLLGMLGYYAGTVFGFAIVPAGIGTLIMSTQPLIIALFAWGLGTERLGIATILGLIVSFAGSILLVGGDSWTSGVSANTTFLLGCLLIFLAGTFWCVFVVFSKDLIQRYGALKITGLSNLIIMLPALPFISGETFTALSTMSLNAYLSLAVLVLIGATAAVFTWNYAAGHLRPTLLGSSLYIIPVLALFAGWAFLNEAVSQNTLLAASLILAGVAISQYKPKQRQLA